LSYPFARCFARGDVYLVARDVHVLEEILPHVAVVTVRIVGPHRVVLVEIERHHVGEVHFTRLVAADQLAIDAQGGAARSESEHAPAVRGSAALDDLDDVIGEPGGDRVVIVDDHGGQPLGDVGAFDETDLHDAPTASLRSPLRAYGGRTATPSGRSAGRRRGS